jgi:hypothetical protein
MSSFFGEVKPELQAAFAHHFNITDVQLEAAKMDFAAYSGESYAPAA